jgi:hypothetical protein
MLPAQAQEPESTTVKRETEAAIGDRESRHPVKDSLPFSMVWPRELSARRRCNGGAGEDGSSAVGTASQTTRQFKCCTNTTGQGLRLRRNPFPRLRNTIETECVHRGPRIGACEESPWAFPPTPALGVDLVRTIRR